MKPLALMTTKSYAEAGGKLRRPASAVALKQRFPVLARIFLPPLLGTTFLWLTSPNDISPVQWFAAFILLCAPWGSYCQWNAVKRGDLPLFAMIGFIFWLYYGFPLFWGDRFAVTS